MSHHSQVSGSDREHSGNQHCAQSRLQFLSLRMRIENWELNIDQILSPEAILAQRSFALELRGLARRSSGDARTTSRAISEKTPSASKVLNDFFTRRSSPEWNVSMVTRPPADRTEYCGGMLPALRIRHSPRSSALETHRGRRLHPPFEQPPRVAWSSLQVRGVLLVRAFGIGLIGILSRSSDRCDGSRLRKQRAGRLTLMWIHSQVQRSVNGR